MEWNRHSNLDGRHAFLSASKYSWLNYDKDHLRDMYFSYLAKQRGTRLHEFAAEAISLGVKLAKNKKTLNCYVNDAIGFGMDPEVKLYYSENCFGTADSISFRQGFLRIHDLKTGEIPASMHQLEIYAGLFCLEYHQDPHAIKMELRIYQNDDILAYEPDPDTIAEIMDKIVEFDKELRLIIAGGA